jgi:RES domain-containing protein
MRLGRVGPDEIFHRFLTPKWAFNPTSGAGAALRGGRFNRPGAGALYLSRAPQTALEEYRQGASIAPPATLVAYRMTVDEVVDLSGGYDPALWSAEWAEWDCPWKEIARMRGGTPPSWRLGDRLIAESRRALLYPSLRHAGGVNLVVFTTALTAADRIEVHDPDGLLPRDQSSWTDPTA